MGFSLVWAVGARGSDDEGLDAVPALGRIGRQVSGERSRVGLCPSTVWARYSPTAGDCMKPCPEKPVA